MTFRDYMVQKLNGRKWVVARQSPRLIAKGYEVFFTKAQFKAMSVAAAQFGCADCFWGDLA